MDNLGSAAVPCGLAIADDGSILLAGTANAAVRWVNINSRWRSSPATACSDPSFGEGGTVLDDFDNHDNHATAVALQSDGGILVAGYSDILLPGPGPRFVRRHPRYDLRQRRPGFDHFPEPHQPCRGSPSHCGDSAQQPDPRGRGLQHGRRICRDAIQCRWHARRQFWQVRESLTIAPPSLRPRTSPFSPTAASWPRDFPARAQSAERAGVAGNVPMLARLTAADIAGESLCVESDTTPLPISGDASVAANTPYTLTLGDGTTDLGIGQ